MNPETSTLDSALLNRNLKSDYLSGDAALRPFYSYPIGDPDFSQIMRDKVFPQGHREVLHAALLRQYLGVSMTESTRRNVDLLLEENTFTLTTGHQLNLFGGPLYTPYKVLTVIKLAQELAQKYPDNNFVPVFWIHTEDHDYQEINHYYKSFQDKVTYPSSFRGATGDHVLTEEILSLIPAHFPEELKDAYQPGRSLAEATLRFHNTLFGKYGLVILDARDPELKALFTHVLQDELQTQQSHQQVSETSLAMTHAGYSPQITPREVNLFYLDAQGRNRIAPVKEGFKILGTGNEFTLPEILDLVQTSPEQFSPNVSLRPLYQEVILPNLAYCGGWAEVAYWMQLKGVFSHYGVNFPLLLPRMAATLFREEEAQQWEALGFSLQDIGQQLHQLYKLYMPQIWQSDEFDRLSEELLQSFDRLHAYIESEISPTLPSSVEGQKVKTRHFLQNIQKKIYRVIRNNDRKPFEAIQQVKNSVQPDGLVQERILGLGSFADFSPEVLIREMEAACSPLDLSHKFIRLPGQ